MMYNNKRGTHNLDLIIPMIEITSKHEECHWKERKLKYYDFEESVTIYVTNNETSNIMFKRI